VGSDRVVRAGCAAPAALRTGFAGESRRLFDSGSEVGGRTGEREAVVRAARDAGLSLVAYTSAPKAETSVMVLAEEHRATEHAVADDEVGQRHAGQHQGVAGGRDGMAFVDWLSGQEFVSGPIGVVGFCFAGKFALEVAAARPDRIAAAASFHGGGLFTDTHDSPHLVLPRVRARLYFGHADHDHSMPMESIEKFEWALRSWSGDYESEVYEAKHGWMIPGRQVHDPENAARGFDKLMGLFDESLRSAERVEKVRFKSQVTDRLSVPYTA